MNDKKIKLPFKVVRDIKSGFAEQMVEGVRAAIIGGHWRIGDTLPSLKVMAELAGVSLKVPRTAYKRLEREGWLHATPSVGYTVVTPNVSVWKGRVLLVLPLPGYFNRMMAKSIQDRLESKGYLVTAFSPQTFDQVVNSDALEALLLQKFDYVFSFLEFPEVRKRLKESGVPYVIYSTVSDQGRAAPPDLLVGDDGGALNSLVSYCRERGTRSIHRVDFQNVRRKWDGLFRAAGMSVRYVPVAADAPVRSLEEIRQAAYDTFRRLLSNRRHRFPDLFLFTDDYVAAGALLAFSDSGLCAPRDFRFVSFANEGLGITYSRPVTRLAMNPIRTGEAAADHILGALAGAAGRPTLPGAEFVPGETF